MPEPAQYKFGTGELRIGPAGAVALTSNHTVAALQDSNINVEFSEAMARESVEINPMPADNVQYDGIVNLDLTFLEFALRLLEYTCGATISEEVDGDDEYDVFSIGSDPANVPKYCRVEIHGVLTDGTEVIAILPRVKFPGQPIPFQRDGYTSTQLSGHSFPTKGTGTITDQALVVKRKKAA